MEPGHFHIGFWANDFYTNRPDYAAGELYGFDVTGADLTKTDSGQVYQVLNPDGAVAAACTLWQWGCDLPAPLIMFNGWIAIQNTDNCAFWWAGSPGGDGQHVFEDQSVSPYSREDATGDLSWCLTSDQVGPFTGACCSTDFGNCRDTAAADCVRTFDQWHGNQTCAQITCEPEVWACCDGSPPICSMYELLNCSGDWYRFYVCSSTDPRYDPSAFGGAGNLKTCPPVESYCSSTCDGPAAFARALTGGYLYISWDRPGDQHYVIDSFVGFSGAINRIKWWGQSCHVWEGGDCDFAEPAPFVIKFYDTSGTGPDWTNPARTFDPVYADIGDLGFGGPIPPPCGDFNCYTVELPEPYSPGAGTKWISIASKSEDCDFTWGAGMVGGTPGQWFYDNGLCEPGLGQRHRCFCLHTNIRTGACCNEMTGVCANAVQEPDCDAEGGTFYPSQSCNQVPVPGCTARRGACCDQSSGECSIVLVADCAASQQVWLGVSSTCDACCVAPCLPGSTAEGEPPCADGYVDTFNGGCDTAAEAFQHIELGQVICGEFGTFKENPDGSGAELRDSDWYRFYVNSPALVRYHVQPGEVPVTARIYQTDWPTAPCDLSVVSSGSNDGCEELVVSAALEHGRFVATVAPTATAGVACQTPYTAWLEASPAGACWIADECALRSPAVCAALGGSYAGDGETCSWSCGSQRRGDANCDGGVNTFDIDAFVLALVQGQDGWLAAFGGTACDYFCVCDINGDAAVNTFDVDPFVDCLVAGGCSPE